MGVRTGVQGWAWALALLPGCSFFLPEYEAPDVEAPKKWQQEDPEAAPVSARALPETAWWNRYQNPELNRLIEMALRENDQLKVALGNVMKARADLERVQYAWIPSLGAAGGGLFGQAFAPKMKDKGSGLRYDPGDTNIYGYGGALELGYDLNVMSQLNREKAAELNLELVKQTEAAARLAVISQVVATYFSLLGARKQLELQRQAVSLARSLRDATLTQYNDGVVPATAIDAVDLSIAQALSRPPKVQVDVVTLSNALRVLCGQNPGSITSVSVLDDLRSDDMVPAGLPSDVLHNRPDIAIAEYQLEISNANIGLARATFFPSFSLTGLLGAASVTLEQFAKLHSSFWGLFGTAQLPILNMQALATIDASEAEHFQAYHHYLGVVKQAFSEVENTLSANVNHRRVHKTLTYSVKLARNHWQKLTVQQEMGAIGPTEVLRAAQQLNEAAQSLNQAKVQLLLSVVDLYQALGGGYLVKYGEPATP